MTTVIDEVIKAMDELDPTMASDYFPDYLLSYIRELDDPEQMNYLNQMFQCRHRRHNKYTWLSKFIEETLPLYV